MEPPRQRRLTAGRVARLTLAVVIGLVLGLGIDVARSGGPIGWLARRGIFPPYDAIGRQVPVDAAGRTVYLDCRGSGSPTIVFEAGAGTGAEAWGYPFTESAGLTRACAWDRPGLGRSPGRGRHSAADAARDLRAALAAAGERPPFIVVGHSLGGVYTRIFAHAQAAEIDGVVLVDAYMPDLAAVDVAPVPSAYRAGWHQVMDDTNRLLEQSEDLDWAATERELRAADLGDLPLELIFVDQHFRYPDDLEPQTVEGLIDAWENLVLGLSTDARLTIAHGSSHLIQLDRPEVIQAAIRRLVERSRSTAQVFERASAVAPLERPGPAVAERLTGGP
jgi:pimeloyl-ACP methyl ester carboxylesterase